MKKIPRMTIVVVDVLLEDEPQEIGGVVLDRRDPESARGPDEIPDLEDVLEDQGGGNGGDGEIVPLEPEQGVPDDERPEDRKEDPHGHGEPEWDVPADEHDRRGVGPDPHVLGLPQIHLPAVPADRVPAHAVDGEHQELDHGRHGERGMGEEGEGHKEQCETACDQEVQPGEVGEIDRVPYCFHPKSPRGRTTMMRKNAT